MSQTNLLDDADEVGRMIETARADLGGGRAVDIGAIEQKVAAIYGTVAGDIHTSDMERVQLLKRLENLMPQLEALEIELTERHRAAAGA